MVGTDNLDLLSTLAYLDSQRKQVTKLPVDTPARFAAAAGVTLWDKIEAIMESVAANRFTVVDSGHGVGKSVTASTLACWFMERCAQLDEEGVVVTLAPTHKQVNNILWRYMRDTHQKYDLVPDIYFGQPLWNVNPACYAVGLSPRKATAEDLQALHGYHSPNMLIIMDEAPGLPRVLWDAVRSLAVSENNHILAIGNPLSQHGDFFDATQSENWQHIRISCLEHPNVIHRQEIIPGATSHTWVSEYVRDHATRCQPGEPGCFRWPLAEHDAEDGVEGDGTWYLPDAVFESRVLGRPPAEGSDQLISLAWVAHARNWQADTKGAELVIGFDPARYGGDQAAMVCRHGNRVLWVKRRRPTSNNPSSELAGWLKQEAGKQRTDWVFVDEIGVGAGVLDKARELGLPARGVGFGTRASQSTRFANLRAECWWSLREALQRGQLSLGDVETTEMDVLEGDLTAPKYGWDNLGRTQLESKEAIVKRLGHSPDSGDALALTFAAPLGRVAADDNPVAALAEDTSRWQVTGGRGTASRWLVGTGRKGRRWRR